MMKKWAVVGAGPAGIAAVGKLIDAGVPPKEIAWIDPVFKVGDFGQKWRPVSSNTTVKLFLDFLHACKAFDYDSAPDFSINHLPVHQTCLLTHMADPLQWICNHLRDKVTAYQGVVETLERQGDSWQLKSANESIAAERVILAIGAEPKTLSYPNLKSISVEQVMDLDQLKDVCGKDETIAVFGSSHTAIIALYNLTELGANIVNIYRSPLLYAVPQEGWILYDNTGLKGYSAQWARENIDQKSLPHLKRFQVNDPLAAQALESCKKAIYAVGFEKRHSLQVIGYPDLSHNPETGEIAPGVYGFGVAFPQGHYDKAGNYEYRVGLWKFMDYLQVVLPHWLASNAHLY